ncbi:hypothetical protein [Halovivax ruber]|nr:hypothetical protein [Halovivax ruber]
MTDDELRPADRDPHTGIDLPIPEGNARRWAVFALLAVIAFGTLVWLLDLFLTLL